MLPKLSVKYVSFCEVVFVLVCLSRPSSCDVITFRSNASNLVVKSYAQKLYGFASSTQDTAIDKMFVFAGIPLDGCQTLVYPPFLEGVRWAVLVNDTGCGLEKKMDEAKTSGYSTLIVFSTKSQSPVPLGFIDSSWIPHTNVSFLGYDDGLDLKTNYVWGLGKTAFYAKFELLAPPRFDPLHNDLYGAGFTSTFDTITTPQALDYESTESTTNLNADEKTTKVALSATIIAVLVLIVVCSSCLMLSKRNGKKKPAVPVPVPVPVSCPPPPPPMPEPSREVLNAQEEELVSQRQIQLHMLQVQLPETQERIQPEADQRNQRQISVRGISRRALPAYAYTRSDRFSITNDVDRQLYENLNRHLHELLDEINESQYSEAQLKKLLRKFKWENTECGNDVDNCCPICLEKFIVGSKLRRLPCDHNFHELCVIEWLTAQPARRQGCPLCRRFLSDSVRFDMVMPAGPPIVDENWPF